MCSDLIALLQLKFMSKKYSPRAWLNSIYNQNQTPSLFESLEGRTSNNVAKQAKGLLPSRSTDEIRKIAKPNHLKRVQPMDEKGVFRSSNKKVSEDLFSKISEQKKQFTKKQIEISKSQSQFIKRMLETGTQLPKRQKQIRRVKLNSDHPHKAQIVLAEDHQHQTPQFTPNRVKPNTIEQFQEQQMKSIKIIPVSPRLTNNQYLDIIQQETSEYNRVNSQSTFRTPRQLSKPLAVSIQQSSEITEEQDEQLLISANNIGSPIRNYEPSYSILNPEGRQQQDFVSRKLYLSGLKQLYYEQQFQRFDSSAQNLTESIDRELENGVKINQRLITSSHEGFNSVDRLSPIPLEDSYKEYRAFTMQSFQSKEEHQESIIRVVKIEKQICEAMPEVIKQSEPIKGVKRLKVLRKPQTTLSASTYRTVISPVQDVAKQIRTQIDPLFNYCSLRTYSAQNEIEVTPICPIKLRNNNLLEQSTERSRLKGLSLSKKSEDKIKAHSLERSQISSQKCINLNKQTQGKKCKQLIRLGNKILITLEQRSKSKPGIRVISQQKQRSRIKSIKKKII